MYSIISQPQAAVNPEFDLIRKFEKKFHLNNILRASNLKKEKGICAFKIFWLLISMVFTGKKFFTWLETSDEAGIDVGFRRTLCIVCSILQQLIGFHFSINLHWELSCNLLFRYPVKIGAV